MWADQTPSEKDRIKRYQTVRKLGQGSYGTVNLVRSKEDNQLMVMKVVKNMTHGSEKHSVEALQEVKILESVKHPNIVAFKEAFMTVDQQHLCIVMAYCESGDLDDQIKSAKKNKTLFPEGQVMDWFIQLCLALGHLHDQRILHRDLKPQNVFLTNSYKLVKLGDFGITKTLENTAQMAITTIGTPYYFSPELCKNKPYGAKSDVWALGAMTYELMTLKVPFEARALPQLRHKILYSKPAPPDKQYSKEFMSLIAAMLSKSPRRRPSAAQVLAMPFIQQRLRLFAENCYRLAAAAQEKQQTHQPVRPVGSSREAGKSKQVHDGNVGGLQQRQTKLQKELNEKQQALEVLQHNVPDGGALISERQQALRGRGTRKRDAIQATYQRKTDQLLQHQKAREQPKVLNNHENEDAEMQQKHCKSDAEWEGKQAESEHEGKRKEYMSESYTKQYSEKNTARQRVANTASTLKATIRDLEKEIAQNTEKIHEIQQESDETHAAGKLHTLCMTQLDTSQHVAPFKPDAGPDTDGVDEQADGYGAKDRQQIAERGKQFLEASMSPRSSPSPPTDRSSKLHRKTGQMKKSQSTHSVSSDTNDDDSDDSYEDDDFDDDDDEEIVNNIKDEEAPRLTLLESVSPKIPDGGVLQRHSHSSRGSRSRLSRGARRSDSGRYSDDDSSENSDGDDLKRENERLKERITELEAEVRRLRSRLYNSNR